MRGEIELNTCYNENCLDTMARMEDDFVDLTVTSPPYDDLRTYNGYSFPFEDIANELFRITKKGGVVVWIVNDKTEKGSETGTGFRQALYLIGCGFNLHDTMVWEKKNPIPNDPRQNRYIQGFEFMYVFSKGKPKTCNYLKEPCLMAGIDAGTGTARKQNGEIRTDRKEKRKGKVVKDEKPLTNIWKYSNGTICKKHPASFPSDLANDHILSWSNEGDVVYDCFSGSGTTAKMSIINKRNWIASEISKDYCEIIAERTQPNNFEKVEVGGLFSFLDNDAQT